MEKRSYTQSERHKKRFSRKHTLCCASYRMGNDIRYTLTWEYCSITIAEKGTANQR